MNEITLRKYIREYIISKNKQPLQESLLGMLIAYKTVKWLVTDSMDEVEDSYGDLQDVAQDLQSRVKQAIEDVEDRPIREAIVAAAENSVQELQAAINDQRQDLADKIKGEIEGSEELADEMDEDDVNAMVSLAMTATLANVIASLASE
tara:strand:- start:345 stop:791 length:447 start_codon:yes stop_codon:yes gene_type:complete